MLIFFEKQTSLEFDKFWQNLQNENHIFFVLCNPTTQKFCLPILEQLTKTNFSNHLIVLPIEENSKTIESCSLIWQTLNENNADRNSVLLCLGGGVICDVGGFAAACFKRGISHIFFPTTLMAQIDAAIGGKTGINFRNAKNQIGLFAQPLATIIAPQFLKTLPSEEILSAFAEMLKHGLIANKNYWNKLKKIEKIDEITNQDLIFQSIEIKNTICIQDFEEKNERKKLNFGHTIGHAIESFCLTHHFSPISHGHCIALGILAESHLSWQKKMISSVQLEEITSTITKFFPIFSIEKQHYQTIFNYMKLDKKRIDNQYNFTFLTDIGSAIINQQASIKEIELALDYINSIQIQLEKK